MSVVPSKTKHLVVSRFNEDLNWMSGLPLEKFDAVFIYNKGKDNLDLTRCASRCKDTCRVIPLRNVGKCDHTYLYHILTHYHDLPDVTVFLPGCCDDEVKWFNALLTLTVALYSGHSMFVTHEYPEDVRTHFFSMHMDTYESRDKRNRDVDSNPDGQVARPKPTLHPSPVRPFGVWYTMNLGNIVVNNVAYFGIFAASKNHIRNRDFDSYVNLYKYVNTHHNPEAGHYFERAWLAIFHPVAKHPHIYVLPQNRFVKLAVPIFKYGDDGSEGTTEPYTLETLTSMFRSK